MATYSLDQLRADVEKNYATLTIEVGEDDKIDLRNVLRIEPEQRNKIMALLDDMEKLQDDDDVSQVEQLEKTTGIAREALRLAAGKRGNDLVKIIGTDDALAMEILSKWTESTQAGEAGSSSD